MIISTPGLKHVVRTHAETLLKHDVCISKLALGKDGDPATVWERIFKKEDRSAAGALLWRIACLLSQELSGSERKVFPYVPAYGQE